MDRRSVICGGVTIGAGLGVSKAAAQMATNKPAFLFIHGAWHGAWCWTSVLPYLAAAGHAAIAIDLPGYGLNTRFPKSYFKRPLDREAFANELSPISNVTIDHQVAAVSTALDSLMSGGSPPVVLVGHSMGGMPITAVGEAMPQKIRKLVYLAAMMLPPGKPLLPYLTGPESKDSLIGNLVVGVSETARAGRIDPRSTDPEYRLTMKEAFFGDVSDEQAEAAINLLQPDYPVVNGPIMTTAQRWGSIPRSYILTEQDKGVLPALQRRFIREVDEALPASKTDVRPINTSHSPFLSRPAELAKILIELAV